MTIATFEGVVKQGKIKIKNEVQLPDNTVVYVIVPGAELQETSIIYSPRLSDPKKVADFQMEISKEEQNAAL